MSKSLLKKSMIQPMKSKNLSQSMTHGVSLEDTIATMMRHVIIRYQIKGLNRIQKLIRNTKDRNLMLGLVTHQSMKSLETKSSKIFRKKILLLKVDNM